MNKHTPGPWIFSGRDILSLHARAKASGPLVAIVDDNDDRVTEADARLIAAAPDMLEAIENCLWVFGDGRCPACDAWAGDGEQHDETCPAVYLLEAVAKAKGK